MVVRGLGFTAPWERQLDKFWLRHFDELGERFGRSSDGAIEALRADPVLQSEIRRARIEDRETGASGGIDLLGLLFAWHLTGRNSLCPSAPLLDALHQTHLEQAPREGARLPFPVVSILLPLGHEPEVSLLGHNGRLEGLLVCDSMSILEATAMAGASEADHGVPAAARHLVEEVKARLRSDDDRVLGLLAIVSAPASDMTEWLAFPLLDDNLAVCVEEGRRRSVAHGGDAGDVERAGFYLELALKAVLYANSNGADREPVPYVPQRHPGRSEVARATHLQLARRWGSRVLLGGHLTLRESPEPATERPSPVHVDSSLHSVRGHFRRVPHGPGHGERRVQWIPPYERGHDEAGRVVERVYRLT